MNEDDDTLPAARREATLRSARGEPGAERAWQRVLALAPGDPEAHYALGRGAGDRHDFAAAVEHFRCALERLPAHPQLRASLALALEELGELSGAEAAWRAVDSGAAARAARAQLARILVRQHRYAEALPLFEQADREGALDHPLLIAALATCLAHAGRLEASEHAFRRATARGADAPGVRREHAAFLIGYARYAEAAATLEAAVAAGGDLVDAAMLLACRQQLADWRDHASLRDRVVAGVAAARGRGADVVPAFDFAVVCDDPALQFAAARGWTASEVAGIAPLRLPPRAPDARVRLGFVSSDFGDHPVGRLVVALLERLDRQTFEVFAFATAPEVRDAFRQRVERAVDGFVALDRREPAQAARTLAAARIDVLFDLNGLTRGEALRILAHRPARLQFNFLGYTGTLGTPLCDAIVCDAYCLPAAEAPAYAERPVHVEPCYLPSDPARTIDAGATARADYGLPEGATVFCAFAQVVKIVPEMFDVWAALLRDVPGSVLWLRHMPEDRAARLRAEAQRRGVEAKRLFFAPREPVGRYLARFALADLFLDSAPFGSHTTVNDALFSGLPVVTLAGRSFAARASASQLAALGMTALIARDHAHYAADRAAPRARAAGARKIRRATA